MKRRSATSASVRPRETVGWEDLVKGYEYEKGHFVVLTKDDFKTAAVEKTKTIDIIDFRGSEANRRALLRDAVLLQPAKGAERSYALLREAIRESGKLGVSKIILRDAQHSARVEAIGDALVLTMMRFADELADLDEFKFPKAEGIRPAELKWQCSSSTTLSAEWEPGKYTDEYRDNLMKVIQAKLKGRRPHLKERETAQSADVVDLMARLRASLERKAQQRRSRGRTSEKAAAGKARHAA
jgi:DNA end-binding protein Ku